MASKTAQNEPEKAEVIEELIDQLDSTLDRVKVLYEQFFLGMQKQPPTHLHTDVERKLRDLTQMQIRNTALRYRFATLQQKFGSYNTYWRRTLRQIENGTYARNLAKIGRQAVMTGEEIPEEILAAMPKRMRDQVKRDREIALAQKKRREQTEADVDVDVSDLAGSKRKRSDGAFHLDDSDDNFDLDAYFKSVTNEDKTNPDLEAFNDESPTGQQSIDLDNAATPPARPAVTRAPTFDAELATDHDLHRPQPRSTSPTAHPNPAVRAAVGMRLATPPAGVPVAPRITPTGMPAQRATTTGPQPVVRQSGQMPAVQPPQFPRPATPLPGQQRPSGGMPAIPRPPNPTGPMPAIPQPQPGTIPPSSKPAPSQGARPLPVMPGAASTRGPVPVESMSGPFPREAPQRPSAPPQRSATPQPQRQQAPPKRVDTAPGMGRQGPPPGMTDADVNALYANYVKAKEAVGEKAGPGSYGKLLQTINAQAPKIMEQYKAKGVDFQVVVKDNQVVIRAKPKP